MISENLRPTCHLQAGKKKVILQVVIRMQFHIAIPELSYTIPAFSVLLLKNLQ